MDMQRSCYDESGKLRRQRNLNELSHAFLQLLPSNPKPKIMFMSMFTYQL